MAIRTWFADGRRPLRRRAGFEEPASLVSMEGFTLKSGNLSSVCRRVSRARKAMEKYPHPDENLASELRQGAGREWAEEAAEDERLTELQRRRNMTLGDQAKEMVNRGDRVSVDFSGHTFGGAVAAAGEDYATVDGPGQTADIKLAEARWSVLPLDTPGETGAPGAATFQALLHEYSAAGNIIRLALPGGDMVIGTLKVVAGDHVEVEDVDQRRLIVPTKMILAVVRSSEVH